MVPGDWHSFLIETRRNPVEEIGPVHIVLDIFLAGPNNLYGTLDVLGDLDSANHTIDFQPPAKPTADQMVVDHDLVQRQPGGLRRRRLGSRDDWEPTQTSQ